MTRDPMVPATPTVFLERNLVLASSRDMALHFGVDHALIVQRIENVRDDPKYADCFLRRGSRFDMKLAGFEAVLAPQHIGTPAQRDAYREAFRDMQSLADKGLAVLATSLSLGHHHDNSIAG